MSTPSQIEQLENAIRNRAQTLADTHLQAAYQQSEHISTEATKRLTKREANEIEIAKTAAEQAYRRRVQASEIKMQAELDQLRWTLVQTVMTQLHEQLKQFVQQEDTYLPLLKQYCLRAAQSFHEQELVAEVNANDYNRLISQWNDFIKANLPNQQCTLASSTQSFMGGILVRDQADRIRIDNTFEGLLSRLETELYQVITTQLFASATATRKI